MTKNKKNESWETELLDTIQKKVFQHFKEHLPDTHVYHNFQHTQDTASACKEIGEHYDLSKDEMNVLLLAAWCHDTGFTKSYEGHEEESLNNAREWLIEEGVDEEIIKQATALIMSTKDRQPKGLLEEILCDADVIHMGKKKFFHKSALLRIERERVLEQRYEEPEWQKLQLDFLINTKFHTFYAASEYGPRKEKNIRKQRKISKKSLTKKTKNKADKIKSRRLGRGIETMYRSTYRNHINLSSIADAKANMMISLNTIILSVIITVVGSGFAFTESWFQSIRFTVPISILLLSSLTAVIFAVVSAKPDVTKKEVNLDKVRNKKSSVLFFGNFSNMELDRFLTNMRELKSDRNLLYDNMSIDIYYLGLVLKRKYRLIRYAYSIFIIGLSISVISFVGIMLYTQL